MAVCPPIDCPTSVTGRPGDAWRITAATSAVNASRDRSAWPPRAVAVSAQVRQHETVAAADRGGGRDELVARSRQPVQRHHDRPVAVVVQVAEPDLVAGDLAAPEPGIHEEGVAPRPEPG